MKRIFVLILAFFMMAAVVSCGGSPEDEAPSEAAVIECLEKVPGIFEIEAVTEENDPNGLLNKAGGYVACVYFSYVLVDEDELYGDSLIDRGTDAGGCIEVYADKKDAKKRDEYLATFDGSPLSPGSHTVVGTVVVRTSNLLTASQQRFLESNVIAALKGERIEQLDSSFREKSDDELTLYTKDLAEQECFSEQETLFALLQQGCSLEKAKKYTESCGVNWNEMAKCRTELFGSMYGGLSPYDVECILEWFEFTQAQIEYALTHSQIDWENSALDYAREYLFRFDADDCITPIMLRIELEDYHKFSSTAVAYAIENCGVDWERMAVRAISKYADSSPDNTTYFGFCIEHGLFEDPQERFRCVVCGEEINGMRPAYVFTRDAVREALIGWGFDLEDINSAIDDCDSDINDLWGWFSYIDYPEYWLAQCCFDEWMGSINRKPTRAEAKEKLHEYGFDMEICEYTVEQWDSWYFQN